MIYEPQWGEGPTDHLCQLLSFVLLTVYIWDICYDQITDDHIAEVEAPNNIQAFLPHQY